MYMRDPACCAGTMVNSTAPDLVRVGLANRGSINGELAGVMVMSLMTLCDSGIVRRRAVDIAHEHVSRSA
jgi:hypothetical protein